jgi:hypothetical protein
MIETQGGGIFVRAKNNTLLESISLIYVSRGLL